MSAFMLRYVALTCGCALLLVSSLAAAPPNIVLIYADDLGYGDVGCQGATGYTTPHLDQLAKEGVRFTHFYTAAAVCSASRAALLTGCYPLRVGILGALDHTAKHGIHANEELLPEVLKRQGYATAIFGKWHLGHLPPFLPTRHGFDEYFGLPYSNDMWPNHPTSKKYYPDLPLLAGEKVERLMPDQAQLTTWYTEHAVKFMEAHRDRPFFVYLPHSMPHVPLFVSDKFRGKTKRGLYGDVISELDWSVGEILKTLQRLKLDDQTLVLFSSDNGPWLSYGNHAGSAGPLREGKGTTWEGGMRVPLLARWPGHFPAGQVCQEVAGTIDLLPTLANIAGAELAAKHPIDGRDIGPLLRCEPNAKSPHEAYYYYWLRDLCAVRQGPWKLVFPHQFPSLTGPAGKDGQPGGITRGKTEQALYHLLDDVGERHNVAADHPDIVKRLEALAELARADLGDALTKRPGSALRPAGTLVVEPGKNDSLPNITEAAK